MTDDARLRPGPGRPPWGGPPPPPPEKLEALAGQETELIALCRSLGRRYRKLTAALAPVERESRRRRERLERQWFFRQGDRPPRPVPGPESGGCSGLREAWLRCVRLEEEYAALADNAPDREQKQFFTALRRSAGESRRRLRELLDRWMG